MTDLVGSQAIALSNLSLTTSPSLVGAIGAALVAFSQGVAYFHAGVDLLRSKSLDGNSFKNYGKVAPKSDYFWQRWSADKKKTKIIKAFSNRSSSGADRFVLNVEELASLWHFPQVQTKAPLLKKVESRKVEPPFSLPAVPDELPGLPDA